MQTIEELNNKYKNCNLCKNCITNAKVCGYGPLDAKLCIIGEGPGHEEVEKGIPFIGLSGQLLDKILLSIGINRNEVYTTNSILCRTSTKNRTPTNEEYSNCQTRLFEELNIIKPRFTLLLGNIALRSVMGNDNLRISECHGKWFTHLNEPCYFYYAMFHPAWILHSSTEGETKGKKQTTWIDIKKFRDDIKSLEENFKFKQELNAVNGQCGDGLSN